MPRLPASHGFCLMATRRWLFSGWPQIGKGPSVAAVTISLVDVEIWKTCERLANILGNNRLVEHNVVSAVILLLNCC